jgi:hypothetical protein
MSLRHLQTPTADPVKAEIAAAREVISHLDRTYPRDADHDVLTKAAWARLRTAEERDAETMTTRRAWHVRMLAEYEAAGQGEGADEHRDGIAWCDAALARLAAPEMKAAA